MTIRSRRALMTAVAGIAAVAVPLTGCSTPYGKGAADPGDRAGRQLKQEEAEQALPEVPQGAEAATPDELARDRATTPTDCVDVMLIGPTKTDLDDARVVRAQRSWSASSPAGSQYIVTIESYSHPVGTPVLDQAGAAMSSCGEFTYTGTLDSEPFNLHLMAQPRPVRPRGEQTFANRITIVDVVGGKRRKIFVDRLVVRDGHNLVHVAHSHWDEATTFEGMETYAGEMLTDLEE